MQNSALETLFSTDANELTHKLSERVSLFKEYTPKIKTFKFLEITYDIRGKLIHDNVLHNKLRNKQDFKKIDNILRLSLSKIIWDDDLRNLFDSKNEIIGKYSEELIFN